MTRTTHPTSHDTPTDTLTDTLTDTPCDGASDTAVRYEPCASHLGTDIDGPCAGCGWLAGDHAAAGPTDRRGLAVVIEVVAAAPARTLRRAS